MRKFGRNFVGFKTRAGAMSRGNSAVPHYICNPPATFAGQQLLFENGQSKGDRSCEVTPR